MSTGSAQRPDSEFHPRRKCQEMAPTTSGKPRVRHASANSSSFATASASTVAAEFSAVPAVSDYAYGCAESDSGRLAKWPILCDIITIATTTVLTK